MTPLEQLTDDQLLDRLFALNYEWRRRHPKDDAEARLGITVLGEDRWRREMNPWLAPERNLLELDPTLSPETLEEVKEHNRSAIRYNVELRRRKDRLGRRMFMNEIGEARRLDAQEVKSRVKLSEVYAALHPSLKLAVRGDRTVAQCYHHSDKSPSLSISDAKGAYFCHSEQYGGDHYRLIMDSLELTFPDAVRWLDEFARQ